MLYKLTEKVKIGLYVENREVAKTGSDVLHFTNKLQDLKSIEKLYFQRSIWWVSGA